MSATSLLGRPEDAPLRSRDALASFGRTLVVAPHQDDESLGCGGAIALLRELGHPVHALFVTDGSMSHPTSLRYPAPKLSQLREQEALAALQDAQRKAGELMQERIGAATGGLGGMNLPGLGF